jgi:hypothetical protein
MIHHTYESGIRAANVCKQQGQWVVMMYEHNQYKQTVSVLSESRAEVVAEDWVYNESV